MRFIIPLACIGTFCIIMVGIVHTAIPFGLIAFAIIANVDGGASVWERVLALMPLALLVSTFFFRSKIGQGVLFLAGSMTLVIYTILILSNSDGPNITSIPFFAVTLYGNFYFLKPIIVARPTKRKVNS